MKSRKRNYIGIIIVLILSLCAVMPNEASRPAKRTSKTVKSERTRTSREIERTNRQISENLKRTKRNVNALRSIEADIASQNIAISKLKDSIDNINLKLDSISASIDTAESRLATQKGAYAEGLRKSRTFRQQLTSALYIFASKDFNESSKRVRYLKERGKWRVRESIRLKSAIDTLNSRKKEYEAVLDYRNSKVSSLLSATQTLDQKRRETSRLVAQLKTKGAELKSVLSEQQKHMRELDRELDKLIAEEMRKQREAEARAAAEARRKAQTRPAPKSNGGAPKTDATAPTTQQPTGGATTTLPNVAEENRRLSGSFAQNKGRLLFPVAGRYKIVSHFGRNQHSELKKVEVNNNGIDIEVTPGTYARAIFDGEVSAAFRLGGYENVVMLRHGNYLTVYAGLGSLMVRKGQKIRAGEPVGQIATDSEDGNRTVLHFEIRDERKKLNPMEWVR